MASVEIRIHAMDIRETDVHVQESSRLVMGDRSDLADVPATLGIAVARALHAVAPDRYRAAAWELIEQLGVGAVAE